MKPRYKVYKRLGIWLVIDTITHDNLPIAAFDLEGILRQLKHCLEAVPINPVLRAI